MEVTQLLYRWISQFKYADSIWIMVKIFAIILPLLVSVAYMTYAERKIIGFMQIRLGPNRVGPFGLLQPIADAMKLLMKEIITPTLVNKGLYYSGPIIVMVCALIAWAVIPFSPRVVLADINVGLLYVMAVTSISIYGVIIAGWASNSRYAFLGAMRASAQIISYEIAMGFSLVGVVMVSGSLNLSDIVIQQSNGRMGGSLLSWNWLPLFPLFITYFIAGIAETNRAPFDMAESESELVAGHMIEYSGMAFAIFFLAEYANMILIAALTAILFLGGWLSPFPNNMPILGQASILWFIAKIVLFLFFFLWIRATFPRYRYDQVMRLGWKILIPVTLTWIMILGVWMQIPTLSIWN